MLSDEEAAALNNPRSAPTQNPSRIPHPTEQRDPHPPTHGQISSLNVVNKKSHYSTINQSIQAVEKEISKCRIPDCTLYVIESLGKKYL